MTVLWLKKNVIPATNSGFFLFVLWRSKPQFYCLKFIFFQNHCFTKEQWMLSVVRAMKYIIIIFSSCLRQPSSSRCRQDEEKKSDLKKKQSLPAGHRMKIKPWFWKTMVLTCILNECKLLCFHGFEKPWFYETMVFQGHRTKILWIFGKPWFRKTMVFWVIYRTGLNKRCEVRTSPQRGGNACTYVPTYAYDRDQMYVILYQSTTYTLPLKERDHAQILNLLMFNSNLVSARYSSMGAAVPHDYVPPGTVIRKSLRYYVRPSTNWLLTSTESTGILYFVYFVLQYYFFIFS